MQNFYLQVYQGLNLDDIHEKEQFISHFSNDYPQLMNDWTHFMSKHNDMIELEELFETNIISAYESNKCKIQDCSFTNRHHHGLQNIS